MASSGYTCEFSGCNAYFSKQHALDVHRNRCLFRHGARNTKKLIPQVSAHKRGRHALSIPRRLGGKGPRLPCDRISKEMCNDQYDCDESASFRNYREEMCGEHLMDPIVSPKCDTFEAGDQENQREMEVVDSFLQISKCIGNRSCNEHIALLCKHYDLLSSVLFAFDTIDKMKHLKEKLCAERLKSNGFRKVYMVQNCLKFSMYRRDPLELLADQIRSTPRHELITTPKQTDEVTHPMNGNIGTQACVAVQDYIKDHSESSVRWCGKHQDGEDSFVAALQLFSDKSQTSLGANSVMFYPVHVTLLNFTEEWRRKHINGGNTIFAYLPIRHDINVEESVETKQEINNTVRVSRLLLLRTLHFCLHESFKQIRTQAVIGLSVKTRDGCRLRAHFMLASYVADLPEAEDLLAVKRGSMTSSPCCRCDIGRDELANGTVQRNRTVNNSIEIIQRYELGDNNAAELMSKASMLPLLPIFADFPMVGIHPSVDVYRIFRFEPLHFLSLGISPMLKECLSSLLKDESRFSTAMPTQKGQPRKFKDIRRKVLNMINHFLKVVEKSSEGYGLHVDFSKTDRTDKLDGFFTETGLVGMIEAKDHDNVDMVSPFIGAIADRCCGLSHAPITSCFVKYVQLYETIFRYGQKPGWTRDETNVLRQDIAEFKKLCLEVFSAYQPSEMRTTKFHMLDHLPSDLEDVGNISCLHAGIYEWAHKLFKEGYRRTSKRRSTAVDETVKLQNQSIILQQPKNGKELKRIRANDIQIDSVNNDGGFLIHTGPMTSIGELDEVRKALFGSVRKTMPAKSDVVRLVQFLGDDGVFSLIDVLRETFSKRGLCFSESHHVRLQLPSSAYVSGTTVPTLMDLQHEDSVFVKKSTLRFSQRVVSKIGFYGHDKIRMDDVLIESDVQHRDCPSDSHLGLWIGKAMTFIRICDNGARTCEAHDVANCRFCPLQRLENEFCFVQYYEIIPNKALAMDDIDKRLNCLRLRWERKEHTSTLSAARSFGLVPVDSLRGRVHVVRGDTIINALDKDVARKKQLQNFRDGFSAWSGELFYLNRFYRSRDETYEFTELAEDIS